MTHKEYLQISNSIEEHKTIYSGKHWLTSNKIPLVLFVLGGFQAFFLSFKLLQLYITTSIFLFSYFNVLELKLAKSNKITTDILEKLLAERTIADADQKNVLDA